MDSRVSVVIAVHNSARTLEKCLQALAESEQQPLECLVVDDASTDDAQEVAGTFGAQVLMHAQRLGPARARNLGARHARGGIVLFLDADVCIHSDAIGRMVDQFRRDPSLDAVIGAYDDSPAASPFVSQYRNLLHCFTHRAGRRDASTFWSGCGAVRKEAFLRCGGMDERYGAPAIEDIEFGHRVKSSGGRILLDPSIQVQHLKCWTFVKMIKTDIFDRGIPWARLILREGRMPNDLNLRWSQRLSVAMAFLLLGSLGLGEAGTALGAFFALICLNLSFYFFLRERRGVLFAVRAAPFLILFHVYSGIAFLLGTGLHLRSLVRPSASEVPEEETL
jgi:GT2 family glycosyltransferase